MNHYRVTASPKNVPAFDPDAPKAQLTEVVWDVFLPDDANAGDALLEVVSENADDLPGLETGVEIRVDPVHPGALRAA